jgi:hypothetical protein
LRRQILSRQNTESYLLPIFLTLILISCAQLLNLIKVRDYFIALPLVAVLIGGTFGIQLLAFRVIRRRERDVLFELVSNVVISGGSSRKTSSVLSESEVFMIESSAHEVWIYAYDLAWEEENSPFTKLVRDNLARGVKYRYLVPNDPAVLNRVQHICGSVSQIRNVDSLIKFRATRRERLITQFGLVIYNPNFRASPENGEHAETTPVVVFFPHFSDFSSGVDQYQPVFLATYGASTARIQEAFFQYWKGAKEIAPLNLDI